MVAKQIEALAERLRFCLVFPLTGGFYVERLLGGGLL